MHLKPPENPTEDRLIRLLDLRVPLWRQEEELRAIRVQMHLRERARLKFLRRRAKLAEARA